MTKPPLHYTLSFSDRVRHRMQVELTILSAPEDLTLWMPVWTPGSYLVREYSRHVQDLTATADGKPAVVRKVRKNRWAVEAPRDSPVRVTYTLYCREKSVRTNWVDSDHALVIGANTFLTVQGHEDRPHAVSVDLPTAWRSVHTAMPRGEGGAYLAADLDELIDSPLLIGNPVSHAFEVDSVPFHLVNEGECSLWDGPRSADDVKTIVGTYRDMFGSLPLDRYLFLNLIVEAGGGLEHKHSTVLMTSRYNYRDRKKYVQWLGLVSHEFFHVWNVKRSRPAELGPFDYENEVYTRNLWVAEGITAYYTDLVPHRAGLTTQEEYLGLLSDDIEKLQNTPGRFKQSLEEASYDAWIKLYRRDENTVNSTVSYYLKGGIVAWMLDAEIRHASDGERSLDDLMRLLFERYSGERGFSEADVQAAAEEVAGAGLGDFFEHAVRSTKELDYSRALKVFGLKFKEPAESKTPWLGTSVKNVNGRLMVSEVMEGGPGYEAGLNVEDEILALGGFRVTPETFKKRLKLHKPGDRVGMLVARTDAVREMSVTLSQAPKKAWRLVQDA